MRSRAFVLSPSGKRRALPELIADGPLAWSPDGKLIAWARWRGSETTIDVVRPDGRGHRVLTRLAERVQVTGLSWSPDSRRLAFSASRSTAD
jgi:Tol biopolymer transport system component